MARCRPDVASLIGGALLGAAIALVLIPDSRRVLRRAVRGWLQDLQAEEGADPAGVDEEAGATEGGLAATRDWAR
jgi:hypothetical protein